MRKKFLLVFCFLFLTIIFASCKNLPSTNCSSNTTETTNTNTPSTSENNIHVHQYDTVVIVPTCTENGYTIYTCIDCNDSYISDETTMIKHQYEKVITDATCESDGYTTYTCNACDESYVDSLTSAIGHNYNITITNPTCKNDGYTTYTCNLCNDTYTKDVTAALGHKYETTTIAPTKEAKGYDLHKCKQCGNSYKNNYVDKLPMYPLTYSDETCTITITKEWYKNAWCYIAHLEFTDYDRFGSALAKNKRGSYETTSAAAKRLGAIFCVNGPYSWGEMGEAYAIVRNGIVYHDIKLNPDVAVYNATTGEFASVDALGLNGVIASEAVALGKVTDTFKFYNSPLVINGGNVSNINNSSRAQRTFIGTTGKPGEIYIIVSEGRYVDGNSSGLTKYQCAEVLIKLGCNYGVMLDGGGSSTMYFNGKVLNSANGNERAVVDFLYFK